MKDHLTIMLNSFFKMSKKKYEMINDILWMLIYYSKPGVDVKKVIISYIESEQFNAKIQ